jgi:hypothetical protein
MSTFDTLMLLLAFALLGGFAWAVFRFAGRRARQDSTVMYGAYPVGDGWMDLKSDDKSDTAGSDRSAG